MFLTRLGLQIAIICAKPFIDYLGLIKNSLNISDKSIMLGPDQKTVTFCNGPHILCQVSSQNRFLLTSNHHHHHHHHLPDIL